MKICAHVTPLDVCSVNNNASYKQRSELKTHVCVMFNSCLPTFPFSKERCVVQTEKVSVRHHDVLIQCAPLHNAVPFVMAVHLWDDTLGLDRSLFHLEMTTVKSVNVWYVNASWLLLHSREFFYFSRKEYFIVDWNYTVIIAKNDQQQKNISITLVFLKFWCA